MSHRTALLLSLSIMLLTTFGDPPTDSLNLPEITMTSGGGFDPTSQQWTIAPDGSWMWVQDDRRSRKERSGTLTETQRNDLAVLATDPRLRHELRLPHRRCDTSDGDEEHLKVGPLGYLADWCHELRPHIDQLRERIRSLTAS